MTRSSTIFADLAAFAYALLSGLAAVFLTTTLAQAASAGQKIDRSQMDHSKMNDASDCDIPMGEGIIKALDVKKSTVTILHKPKDSVGFEEMAMDFTVLKPVDLSAFAVGERVHFLVHFEMDDSHIISAMCSLDIDLGAHQACMANLYYAATKQHTISADQCGTKDQSHDEKKSERETKYDRGGHH